MGNKCSRCYSYAINPGRCGRSMTSDLDLCDVCYWRVRHDSLHAECLALRIKLDLALAAQPEHIDKMAADAIQKARAK